MANRSRKPAKRVRRTSIRELIPINQVLLISLDGLVQLPAEKVDIQSVGAKAHGLACLPQQWVSPFFVVNGGVINDQRLGEWITAAVGKSGLNNDVMVRSSGTAETMEHRGRLLSDVCDIADVVQKIRVLSSELQEDNPANIHWLVQKHIDPRRKGHLSNERRMSRESRDWVAEFEMQGNLPGFTVPVAIRHWRVGDKVTDFDLDCNSEPGVTLKLKTVALWSTGFSSRLHFEWVWSGTGIWLVQADVANTPQGVNPQSLFPSAIPVITPSSLGQLHT